ncbi:MAG: hypothetical protein GXX96_39855 [Planctomycetaceae bacterium]|nr:hypothetical protein [Planctomycetaceae bacterium]
MIGLPVTASAWRLNFATEQETSCRNRDTGSENLCHPRRFGRLPATANPATTDTMVTLDLNELLGR